MDEDVIETAGRYRVRLVPQSDAPNPREENDCYLANVITMRGQRYADVEKDMGPLEYGWEYYSTVDNGADLFIRWARTFHGAVAVENRPHDGANTIWYVMPDKLAESTWPAEKIIEEELAEYDAWRRGEVYGYVVERSVVWVPEEGQDYADDEPLPESMTTWDDVESVGGFIGRAYAEEEAREALARYKEDN